MRIIGLVVACAIALPASSAPAQTAPAPPVTIGTVVVSGSLRTRVEGWDWFQSSANGDYAYPGSIARLSFRESRRRFDWQVEVAAPFLLALPADATAPGAQGQLGLGAAYFSANGNRRNVARIFVKQGFARFKNVAGRSGRTLTVGRMEFADGAEVPPANATVAALKRDRIAQRLLGAFGFSHAGRSFDGVQYSEGGTRWTVTGLAARPTQGVFQAGGWDELKINVFYGALTRQVPGAARSADWRVFGLAYRDSRRDPLKTDNRPLTARRADTGAIDIVTFGGHYIGTAPTRRGTVDVLLWGALQRGSWGSLSQRSGAFAAEAGWQPPGLTRVRPWLRGGWNLGSGDGDPDDRTHGTFFQVLPTPRTYARFPFFNMMNASDGFAELVLRPAARVTTRVDAHALRLADAGDLWYQGGGAFQPDTFGFAGRPSNGAASLAALYDASVDYAAGPHVTIGGYAGFAAGGAVVERIYPRGHNARFGYAELTLRF